jgi:putative ABC transport system ATP-binding protein
MMEMAIEIRGLRKTYHTDGVAVEALRGVDLQVAPGEFLAVMGPSGCGKSTLLHLLGGLDRPTGGEVTVARQRMDTLDESARAVLRREMIGFVFQAYNLIPNLTVADNVDLPGLLTKRPPAEVAVRREALLAALGLSDRANAFPGELSGGEQQRVAIARALGNRPTVLLVDEPTGNLDSRSGAEVMTLLRRFHQEGQTIVLVTHDPNVASFAGRVIFMRDGHLLDEASLVAPGDAATVLSRLAQLEI